MMVQGKPWLCKPCNAAKTKDWRARTNPPTTWVKTRDTGTPEQIAELREKHRLYQKKSDERRFAKMSEAEIAVYKADIKAKKDFRMSTLKGETYAAYGGPVCNCCGETEPLFLSIDHVNNDGNLHRKEIPKVNGGYSMYVWLKRQGFPAGFQILCMNCQTGKMRNNGICPHSKNV
ncbi:hypothetical protein [Aureimonas sp. AU20]|uniref:hypothetical protein n=1 Tax=Aureimonas sp. AU20 TaxID=1349819 RepID=UPI0011E01A36|nr:hypothetical protein [Aureimonas sp. AU20]